MKDCTSGSVCLSDPKSCSGVDGVKGFSKAIAVSFSDMDVQLCIVQQIRNSLRPVASKHQKEFMADLKLVYNAQSLDLAEYNFMQLEEK